MSSYRAKDSLVQARQLEAQSLHVGCDPVAGTSVDPSLVSVDNTTLTATVITINVGEPISRCFKVDVTNRATGAVVAIAAAPSLAVANKISVTINGTGLSDVAVEAVYKVSE